MFKSVQRIRIMLKTFTHLNMQHVAIIPILPLELKDYITGGGKWMGVSVCLSFYIV